MAECLDKKKYATRRHAQRAAQLVSTYRNAAWRGPLHAYHCEWCGYFHIGHVKTLKQAERERHNTHA